LGARAAAGAQDRDAVSLGGCHPFAAHSAQTVTWRRLPTGPTAIPTMVSVDCRLPHSGLAHRAASVLFSIALLEGTPFSSRPR
jgi:hypothetical protein